MDVFGAYWQDHDARIVQAWRERIGPENIVLVAGDISWVVRLEKSLGNLRWIESLLGHKVFIKGNHDY